MNPEQYDEQTTQLEEAFKARRIARAHLLTVSADIELEDIHASHRRREGEPLPAELIAAREAYGAASDHLSELLIDRDIA